MRLPAARCSHPQDVSHRTSPTGRLPLRSFVSINHWTSAATHVTEVPSLSREVLLKTGFACETVQHAPSYSVQTKCLSWSELLLSFTHHKWNMWVCLKSVISRRLSLKHSRKPWRVSLTQFVSKGKLLNIEAGNVFDVWGPRRPARPIGDKATQTCDSEFPVQPVFVDTAL